MSLRIPIELRTFRTSPAIVDSLAVGEHVLASSLSPEPKYAASRIFETVETVAVCIHDLSTDPPRLMRTVYLQEAQWGILATMLERLPEIT